MRPSTTTADPTLVQGPSRADLEEARPNLKSKRWIKWANEQVMTEIANTVYEHFEKCRKANIAYDIPPSLAALTRPASSRAEISDLITCLQTAVRRAHIQDYDMGDPGTGTDGVWTFR